MKKNELKTGHVVEYRDGKRRLVLKDYLGDEDRITGYDGWSELKYTDYDLRNTLDNRELDVVKVYEPRSFSFLSLEDEQLTLVWERESVKEIVIDGETIEISQESYEAFKRSLL